MIITKCKFCTYIRQRKSQVKNIVCVNHISLNIYDLTFKKIDKQIIWTKIYKQIKRWKKCKNKMLQFNSKLTRKSSIIVWDIHPIKFMVFFKWD